MPATDQTLLFVRAGRCDRPPERMIKPMLHQHWSLSCSTASALWLRVGRWNAPWRKLPAGTLLLVAPGVTTWTDESRSGRRFQSDYISFQGQGLTSLQAMVDAGHGHAVFKDAGKLGAILVKRIVDLTLKPRARGHYSGQWALLSELVTFTMTATKGVAPGSYVLPERNALAPEDDVLARVKRYMQENLHRGITRMELAREAGICVSGLSHHVSKQGGRTLMGLLRELRIESAARLLEQGTTLEVAAEKSGFGDVSHFSRTFRRLRGMAPGAYARRVQALRRGTGPDGASGASTRRIRIAREREREPLAVPLYFEHAVRPSLDSSAELTLAYWTLDYYVTGGVEVRVGSKRGSLLKFGGRTAHIYPPETHIWEQSRQVEGNRIEGTWVFFQPLKADLRRFVGRDGLIRVSDPGGVLLGLLMQMKRTVGRSGFQARHQEKLLPLLGETLQRIVTAPRRDGVHVIGKGDVDSGADILVGKVDDYLRKNLGRSLRRGELAGELGLSVSSVAHRYREATGEGPMQALNRFRLERVRELLGRGASVKEAARECGYVDAHYLARCFRKAEGMTPKAFRSLMAGAA